jgi:hypothetical protein
VKSFAHGRPRRWLVATALLLVACGERGPAPTVPGFRHNVVLVLEGRLTTSCEVQNSQQCQDAPFGSGVEPGTPVTLRVTYDSATPPTSIVHLDDLEVARYFGVTAELSVAGTAFPIETSTATYIEVSSTPDEYTMQVTMSRGFDGGTIAGLTVDLAIAQLRITPSRHPDVSLPRSGTEFAAALSSGPFSIALKHHSNPDLASFGLVAPGSIVSGEITAVRAP